MKLRLQGKEYAGSSILGPIDLELKPGEFVALTGPSGVGKTTLLRLLAGLDTDWQGELLIPGSQTCGFMFQEPRLMPWLTALDNLLLVREDRAAALASLASVGLREAADRYPGQLSGGMQRRVALARALLGQPSLILMDEPFSSLDQSTGDACRDILLRCWRQDKPTILFVTHDMNEAVQLAERVLIMGGQPARLLDDVTIGDDIRASKDLGATDQMLAGLQRRLREVAVM